MDYVSNILKATGYIEDHLHEQIQIDGVCKIAGLSMYHFTRIFRALTGDSPGEYIRKRRLTVASQRLITTETRILDIALEAGFESQEAFGRAFKRVYDQTPGNFRKQGRPKLARDRKPIDENLLNHLLGGITMEPQFRTKEQFKVVGLNRFFETTPESKAQIPKTWDEFMPMVGRIKNRVEGPMYGVCLGWEDSGAKASEFSYAPCVEVSDFEDIPEGMSHRVIEKQDYAVFTHKGPIGKIHETIDYIWGSWVPKSKYKAVDAPDFELYDERFNPVDGEFEIWVPISE